jgi:hypothetical protein
MNSQRWMGRGSSRVAFRRRGVTSRRRSSGDMFLRDVIVACPLALPSCGEPLSARRCDARDPSPRNTNEERGRGIAAAVNPDKDASETCFERDRLRNIAASFFASKEIRACKPGPTNGSCRTRS